MEVTNEIINLQKERYFNLNDTNKKNNDKVIKFVRIIEENFEDYVLQMEEKILHNGNIKLNGNTIEEMGEIKTIRYKGKIGNINLSIDQKGIYILHPMVRRVGYRTKPSFLKRIEEVKTKFNLK